MEQELTIKIQFMFFCVTALTGLVILIFCLRRKDDKKVDWEAIERVSKMIDKQTDENIDILSKMNKQKNKIEEKIKDKKKILGMNLVYKK